MKAVPLTALVVLGIVAIVATVSLSASATTSKHVAIPPDAVVTWNTNTVAAVRASSPTKFQTDGMVYMSYVQAAVYDAVTKLEGRYDPYHDFAAVVVPGASVQAAVAAASQTTLDCYLPDQKPTVDAEYNAYIGTLTGNVTDGVALGEAAANDIIAYRTGDGLNGTMPFDLRRARACHSRPVAAAAPSQTAQTPWFASCVRSCSTGPRSSGSTRRPRWTAAQYAKDLNETEAYGAIRQHRPHRRRDGDRVLLERERHQPVQQDHAERRRAAQHGSRRRRAPVRDGEHRHDGRGHRLLRFEVHLSRWRPITAIQNADQDGNPDTTADPAWQALLGVPGHPSTRPSTGCSDEPRSPTRWRGAAHEAHRRHDVGQVRTGSIP